MEDEIIIELFWERSQDALQFMDRKYGRFIRKFAMNILQDDRDAEEAVSDTYMKLWNSIPPEKTQIPAFLHRQALPQQVSGHFKQT